MDVKNENAATPLCPDTPQTGEIVRFRVAELDCAEEIRQLRQALENEPGIVELEFDIFKNRMTVTYDAAVSSPERILEQVAGLGMHASPWDDQPTVEAARGWRQHPQLILAVLSGTSLLVGLGIHIRLSGSLLAALGYGVESVVPWGARLAYSASIVAGVWSVAPKAWSALRRARPDMNLLMIVAVTGAVALGEWFEAATVSFLFCVALLLEHWSMGRARRAIGALMDLSPVTARRVGSDGGVEEVPVDSVAVGTIVAIRPGEKIPLDGLVLRGESSVNEAPITGESVPASKQPGDEVFAGTINEEGAFQFETTRRAGETTLARIVHLVEQAQASRAPSQQWVERFAAYYTPAMMVLSLAIVLVPPLLMGAEWAEWIYRGLVVLVIACPCALVISTPVSIVSSLTAAARQGVLIKGGQHLEDCAQLRAIAFDKTGTLTEGKPVVQTVVPVNGYTREQVLEIAAAMESQSTHPLARAILRLAAEEGVIAPETTDHRLLSGRGAEAIIDGTLCWIGSHRLMHERSRETAEIHALALELEDAGHSAIALGNDKTVFGLIGVADRIRDDAAHAIAALRRTGLERIEMLTGDNEETARAVAEQTGVSNYRAECLPEDKLRSIEKLREECGAVAMVGDGVNDAPAMAVATVGIAMGAAGTDTAIETADIALMSDDLTRLPWLIAHARRTLSIIRQNITFALGIKFAFVALTMIGAASLWMAIAADMGASLLVIFNGLRLLRD